MTDVEMMKELKLYKKLYYSLFAEISTVIELTTDLQTRQLLINALQKAEEMYINAD